MEHNHSNKNETKKQEHHEDHDKHEHHKDHDEHEHHDHNDHHEMMAKDFKKRFIFSMVLLLPILALSPMIQGFINVDWRFTADSYILFALATILFIYGGKPFLTGAIDELKSKNPAMMTLISLAIVVAYVYSSVTIFTGFGQDFFWELATLISVMLLGHWIEMRSVLGASKALDELLKLMPETAHRIDDDGNVSEISASKLEKGMSLLIKPGEKIPADGKIFEGESAVNESMLTGESVPVEKSKGDEVIGGSINTDGSLKIEVSKVGEDSFLSQVVKLVKDAQENRSKTERVADIAAKYLFYIAVTAGITTFIVWISIGQDFSFAMQRAVTVIIIACPHALGLATPLVTAVSSSIGAKHGLLIRDRANFENARKIDTIVFDKTGTLTKGEFGVTDIIGIDGKEDEVLSLAYALESESEHPIAKGISNEGKKQKIKLKDVADFKSISGKGLTGKVDNKKVTIASPNYIKELDIKYDQNIYDDLAVDGKTVVFVISEDKLIGVIALSDIIRESAKKAISDLKELGIESFMLTGDNKEVANKVAKELDIDSVMAEVLPDQKADKIESLVKEGRRVAMTGDGINDAPALAKSHLGIAIGAGTDVAIETADVILVKSNPQDVVNIIKLSKSTYKKMIQNLAWATGYNIIAMPLAAGVLSGIGIILSPAIGAVLMSLSTVIVSINARFLKI